MTDVATRLDEAIKTVLGADTGLHTLCGRTTRVVLRFEDRKPDTDLPVLVYYATVPPSQTGVNGQRSALYQFTAFVAGTRAQARAQEMMERVELGLTATLLSAQGLDAVPIRFTRVTVPMERDGDRALARADIDVEFYLHT